MEDVLPEVCVAADVTALAGAPGSDFDDAPPQEIVAEGFEQWDPDARETDEAAAGGRWTSAAISITVLPGGDLDFSVNLPEPLVEWIDDDAVGGLYDQLEGLALALTDRQPDALRSASISQAFDNLADLTQRDLAGEVGVSESFISRERSLLIRCPFGTVPLQFFSLRRGQPSNRSAEAVVRYIEELRSGATAKAARDVAAVVAGMKPDSFRKTHLSVVDAILEQPTVVERARARFPRFRDPRDDARALAAELGLEPGVGEPDAEPTTRRPLRGYTALMLALLGVIP